MDGLVQGGAVIDPLFNSGILIFPFYSTNLMIKLVTYMADKTVPLTFLSTSLSCFWRLALICRNTYSSLGEWMEVELQGSILFLFTFWT